MPQPVNVLMSNVDHFAIVIVVAIDDLGVQRLLFGNILCLLFRVGRSKGTSDPYIS